MNDEGQEQAPIRHKEVEFTKLLETLEKKTSEIIDLKSNLHISTTELQTLKRAQANNIGAQVNANDQQINAMALNVETSAQQMRSYTDLQSKYMETQRALTTIQTEQMTSKHSFGDQEMKLENALGENKLLKAQTDQNNATVKALQAQLEQVSQKNDGLELRLSTSVTQVAFLAMEGQFKKKQIELNKVNQEMTQQRQENFALRASSDNNKLKVNNL